MSPVEPRTYRATAEAWLGQLILPMAFFGLLTVTAIRLAGMSAWAAVLGLVTLAVIVVLDYLLPMLRNWLLLDARSIEGMVNGRYFNLYWTEIIAAWLYERHRRSFLCLGTRGRTVVIPLRFFDRFAIWESVCDSVAPSALTEEAINSLPDFQEWIKTRAREKDRRALAGMAAEQAGGAAHGSETAVADHWLIQVAAWTGLTFFVLGLLGALSGGHLGQAVLFGGLVVLSGMMLLNWGLTEFSTVSVVRFTLFGGWRIQWDSVRRVEVGLFGAVIVLVGDDCQLVIPGPWLWSGSGRRGAQAMLLAQVEKRGIPLLRKPWSAFKFSRGSRIQK